MWNRRVQHNRWTAWVAIAGCIAFAPAVRADETGAAQNTPVAKANGQSVSLSTKEADPISAWMSQTEVDTPGGSETQGKVSRTLRRGGFEKPGSDSDAKATGVGVTPSTAPFSIAWPMFAILVMIVVVTMFARKLFPKAGRLGGGGVIKVLARQYLSNKQSLCLIRLGNRVVLLGVTPDRISTLTEVVDPEEVSTVVTSTEQARPGSFTSSLADFVSGRGQGKNLDVKDFEAKESEEASALKPAYSVSMETLARTDASIQDLVRRVRTLSDKETSAEPIS